VKKNYDDMLSRFHLSPERYGQTDGRTDSWYITVFKRGSKSNPWNYRPVSLTSVVKWWSLLSAILLY